MWCNMASKNDNVMLVIGLMILLIALVGSATFEGERPDTHGGVFDISIDPRSEVILSQNGDTNEGDSWESPVEVTGPMNITSIVFTLTWNDDDTSTVTVGGNGVRNEPDTFRLTVESSNGLPSGCLSHPTVVDLVSRILAGETSPQDCHFDLGGRRWFGRVKATPIWGTEHTARGALLVVHPLCPPVGTHDGTEDNG